jgi:hypothetical protein
MGAANGKAVDEGLSRETNVIEYIPVCLGCDPICEPKNAGTVQIEPENVNNKWTKSGSFRAGSFGKTSAKNKTVEFSPDQRKVQTVQMEPENVKNKWKKSGSFRAGSFGKTNKAAEISPDQRKVQTPESTGSLQSTHLPTSSNQHLQRSRSADILAPVQRPVIQSSLSFKGTIPPDWDKKQQEQLQLAITEVSRRSKTRAPGARAMQGLMAARSRGERNVTGDYNKK